MESHRHVNLLAALSAQPREQQLAAFNLATPQLDTSTRRVDCDAKRHGIPSYGRRLRRRPNLDLDGVPLLLLLRVGDANLPGRGRGLRNKDHREIVRIRVLNANLRDTCRLPELRGGHERHLWTYPTLFFVSYISAPPLGSATHPSRRRHAAVTATLK